VSGFGGHRGKRLEPALRPGFGLALIAAGSRFALGVRLSRRLPACRPSIANP
jgi:hypothetical protein